jgi:hypothetical protein
MGEGNYTPPLRRKDELAMHVIFTGKKASINEHR